MNIGKFHVGFTNERRLRKADKHDALLETFSRTKGIRYTGQRTPFQKFKFRNYTADDQVNKGYIQSSLGSACISRYEVAYPEPEKQAFIGKTEYSDKGLQKLLLAPNRWMTEMDFDRYLIKYQLLTGNCYWIIDRGSKYGEIKEIFPFNDMNVTPIATESSFIEYYKFVTFDGAVTEYAPEDVIHFPWLFINPLYPNKGISPGALSSRDIDTDTAFGQHIASFAYNDATPGGILEVVKDSIQGAAGISEPTLKKITTAWRKRFSKNGGGAGDITALEPGFTYKQIGSNLKDLDLQYARATPEARACALYLIPPEVVGVNIGLQHSTISNLDAAEQRWTNRSLIPIWKYNAKKFSAGLQNDFPGVEIKYDIDNVSSVIEQRADQRAALGRPLVSFIQAHFSGELGNEIDATRATAEYLFLIPEDEAIRMFPEVKINVLPNNSDTEVTPEGSLTPAKRFLTKCQEDFTNV